MAFYETVVVVDPLAGEGVGEKHLGKIKELIEAKGGRILKTEEWGKRRLAYSINHRREGLYSLVEFEGPGEIVASLDQYYRLQESILRYLTVVREAPSPEGSVSPVATDQGHGEPAESGVSRQDDFRHGEGGGEPDELMADHSDVAAEGMDA